MFQGDYRDSSMVSDRYPVFVELGYPQLDVETFEDGSWAILEYINAPLIPSLTSWKWVYKGFHNIEFSSALAAKLIRQIDPQYPEYWAQELLKSTKLLTEKNERARFEEDWTERMVPQMMANPALMERVARYGMRELDPARIALAIAKENPGAARSLGIKVDNEHIKTGTRESLC